MPRWRLAELLDDHAASCATQPGAVRAVFGDGMLLRDNPFARAVRAAARNAGVRFAAEPPYPYHGHPLLALPELLATRVIPFRDTLSPLRALECGRPGYYTLADLRALPPVTNPLLHESAHVVAFALAFPGVTEPDARREVRQPGNLSRLIAGEAFAVVAEYLALCAASDPLQRFVVQLGSYQREAPGKQRVGELISDHGLVPVATLLMAAQVLHNQLRDRLAGRELDAALELAGLPREPPAERRRLRRGAEALMQLNPAFRRDTARLFLTQLGRSRNLERHLQVDPLAGSAGAALGALLTRLATLLAAAVEQAAEASRLAGASRRKASESPPPSRSQG